MDEKLLNIYHFATSTQFFTSAELKEYLIQNDNNLCRVHNTKTDVWYNGDIKKFKITLYIPRYYGIATDNFELIYKLIELSLKIG